MIHSRICVCGLDSGLKPLRGLDGGNGLFIEKRYRLEIRLSITLPLSQIMRPQLRQSQKAKPQRKAVPSPRKVRDLKGLQEKIQAQFKWEDPPHDFQTEAIKASSCAKMSWSTLVQGLEKRLLQQAHTLTRPAKEELVSWCRL